MTSLTKRTLTTFIGVPLVAIITLLPYYNNIAFNILLFTVSLIGSYELKNLLNKKSNVKLLLPFYVPSLLVPLTYVTHLYYNTSIVMEMFFILLIVAFAIEIKYGEKDNFKSSIDRLLSTTFLIVYPNIFAASFVSITFLNNANYLILIFLLVVFSSDIFAYIFGMLFGKNNRGIVKVSPNKSLVGFIAGIIVPALIMSFFAHTSILNMEFYEGFILGTLLAIAAIAGDLIESVLKRSANIKDSGKLIPGRGGMLDSIDSIVVALPIYIAAIKLLC